MSEPFLGQMMTVGFNFAPRGWAMCDGQILPINQNQSLYSLLGTEFGGDGRTSFALPDLRGRTMLLQRTLAVGIKGGSETVTLTAAQMPAHNHASSIMASTIQGTSALPTSRKNVLSAATEGHLYGSNAPSVSLNGGSDNPGDTGGGLLHENMQPYTVLTICIALRGLFPSRN